MTSTCRESYAAHHALRVARRDGDVRPAREIVRAADRLRRRGRVPWPGFGAGVVARIAYALARIHVVHGEHLASVVTRRARRLASLRRGSAPQVQRHPDAIDRRIAQLWQAHDALRRQGRDTTETIRALGALTGAP